jgi:hypothetical protein
MRQYEQVNDGDWMHLPRTGMLLACCDCSLVHDLAVRVDARNRIWIKVKRHNRSTAALRRPYKFQKDSDD